MSAPGLTYAEFICERARLDAIEREAGARMSALGAGTGPMGLTPDAIRARPDYQAARGDQRRAMAALRALNGRYAVTYRREEIAARDARRMARLAAL